MHTFHYPAKVDAIISYLESLGKPGLSFVNQKNAVNSWPRLFPKPRINIVESGAATVTFFREEFDNGEEPDVLDEAVEFVLQPHPDGQSEVWISCFDDEYLPEFDRLLRKFGQENHAVSEIRSLKSSDSVDTFTGSRMEDPHSNGLRSKTYSGLKCNDVAKKGIEVVISNFAGSNEDLEKECIGIRERWTREYKKERGRETETYIGELFQKSVLRKVFPLGYKKSEKLRRIWKFLAFPPESRYS